MKFNRMVAAAVLAGGLFAGVAQAGTISYSASFGATGTNFANVPLVLNQFDPSLGTLTGIALTLQGSVSGDGTVTNTSPSNTITAVLTLSATVSADGPAPGAAILLVTTPFFTQSFDLAPLETDGFTLSANIDSDSVAVNPADFGLFTGTGTVTFNVDGTATSNGSGSGNILFGFNTQAAAQLEVVYTFSDVTIPEPMSLALFGLGLAGLGAAMRRKA